MSDKTKPLTITVTVRRTIQERPYEPYSVEMGVTLDVSDLTNEREISAAYDKAKADLEVRIDAACEMRRAAAGY